MTGRAASYILRGNSAAELRAFIEVELQSAKRTSPVDLCEVIEEVAIEKLVMDEG